VRALVAYLFLVLDALSRLGVLGPDDGQREVEHEEGAEHDEEDEVDGVEDGDTPGPIKRVPGTRTGKK
jgi:hypothetical protein